MKVNAPRMADEDYQAIKTVLRENGFIPNTKLIYEMAAKMETEIGSLRFGKIDKLCNEDLLIQDEIRREEHRSMTKRMAEYYATTRY